MGGGRATNPFHLRPAARAAEAEEVCYGLSTLAQILFFFLIQSNFTNIFRFMESDGELIESFEYDNAQCAHWDQEFNKGERGFWNIKQPHTEPIVEDRSHSMIW